MIDLTKDEVEIALLIIGESVEGNYPVETQPAELRAAMAAGDHVLPEPDDIMRRFPDPRARVQFLLNNSASILRKLTAEYATK